MIRALRDLDLGKYQIKKGEQLPDGILLPEIERAFIDFGYIEVT